MSEPETNQQVSVLAGTTKSRLVAYLLWGFLGVLGAHRVYLGTPVSGLAMMIFTLSFFGIPVSIVWWVIDAFLIPRMVNEENLRATPLPRVPVIVPTLRFSN